MAIHHRITDWHLYPAQVVCGEDEGGPEVTIEIYDTGTDEKRPATQDDINQMQTALIGQSHLRTLVCCMLAPGALTKLTLKERSEIAAVLARVGLYPPGNFKRPAASPES